MPLQKYYCDYCDKQFQDTPFARKRHLRTLSHQKAKALWFDSFNFNASSSSSSTHHAFPKGVCNRFLLTTGFCPYGDSCKYLHPPIPNNNNNNNNHTPSQSQSQSKSIAGNNQPSRPNNIPLYQFLPLGLGLGLGAGGVTSFTGNLVADTMGGASWGCLPPSLMPPPEAGHPSLPFVDWG